MNYGKAIRTCRVAFGLQQRELADRAGLAASYVCLIEAGKRTPTLRSVDRICDAMGVPTHLMMLLASGPDDLKKRPQKEIEQLSAMLLGLLVGARSTGEAGP